MDVNNAGEYSNFTFTFKTNTGYTAATATAVAETIEITFPHVFDPFVGMASTWFENESTSYYLDCTSTSMVLAWCTVDRWKVTISGTNSVDAASNIDITIKHVALPAAQVTTEKLQLAVRNSAGVVKAITHDFAAAGVTIAAVPANNIQIASVMASSHKLYATSVKYNFHFYLA